MVNSAKTPTGKAKKGQVTVREDSGSIKACFPRTHFAGDKQLKLGTGISLVDGWESTASKLQRRLQIELEDGKMTQEEGVNPTNFQFGLQIDNTQEIRYISVWIQSRKLKIEYAAQALETVKAYVLTALLP